MQQKRLRRKARRDQRAPYQWLPNRKAGRSNSNSSMSSEGSLDLDFDDSVWKPDVKADLKSEFVMAWTRLNPSGPVWGGKIQRCAKHCLGFTLRIGRRCHRTEQRCPVQRGNQSCPCDRCLSHEKTGSLQTLIPFCLSQLTLWKTATTANRTFFRCLDLDRKPLDSTAYQTFYGVMTETIPELEHGRIQWVVVVVGFFSDFLISKVCFLKHSGQQWRDPHWTHEQDRSTRGLSVS